MNTVEAEAAAARVGYVTLPVGLALLVAPSAAARLLRTADRPLALRLIGAADLALVPGLLRGPRRDVWLTARAGLNLVIGAFCAYVAKQDRSVPAGVGVLAMVAATLADRQAIVALRRGR